MINPVISFGHKASRHDRAYQDLKQEPFDCPDCDKEALKPTRAEFTKMHFANASDRDLALLASEGSKEKYQSQYKNGLLGMFVGLPILSSAISTLNNPGSLAKKAGIFTGSMAGWGVSLGILFSYFGVSNALTKGSETLSDFKKEHPLAYTVSNIGVAFGTLFGAEKLLGVGANKLFTKYPSLDVKAISTVDRISRFINESFVAKSIFNPIQKSIAKVMNAHPNATKNILGASQYAVPIVAVGLLIKFFSDRAKYQEEVKDNFYTLKMVQQEVRDEIAV